MVESAELVMNVFASFGCQAQENSSLTCPLKKRTLDETHTWQIALLCVFHVSYIGVALYEGGAS
jgi:hypothetical protein